MTITVLWKESVHSVCAGLSDYPATHLAGGNVIWLNDSAVLLAENVST